MVTFLAVIVMPRKIYLLIADTLTIIYGIFIAWTNQSVWSTDGEWWKEKTQRSFLKKMSKLYCCHWEVGLCSEI